MNRLTPYILAFSLAACGAKAPFYVNKERRFPKNPLKGLSIGLFRNRGLVTDGEHLFFGSNHGVLYSANGRTGKKRWGRRLEGGISSTPLIDGEWLYIGTDKGKLYRIRKDSGAVSWTFDLSGEVIGELSVYDGHVYFGTHLDQLYAIKAEDASLAWKYRADSADKMKFHAFTKPLARDGKVVTGFYDGSLVAFNVKTGEKLWHQSWPDSEKFSDIAWLSFQGERHFLAGKFNGQLALFRWDDGVSEIALDRMGGGANPAEIDPKVVVGGYDGKVHMVVPQTGEKTWTYDPGKLIRWSGMADIGTHVVATSYEGEIHVLSEKTGSLEWIYHAQSAVASSPALVKDQCWILTQRGELLSLKIRNP